MKYLKSIFSPMPSFFDVCVGGILAIYLIPGNDNRSLFIVFYSMFLLILTLGMKPKREYKSVPLMLLALWSFLGMFIHSFAIYPKSITYSYRIFCNTMEGFLYLFFGIVFIQRVVSYSTNPRFIYFFIPFSIVGLIPGLQYVGSSTVLVALGISISIYLLLSRQWLKFGVTLGAGLVIIISKWSWLIFKFKSRPFSFYQLGMNMFYNPMRRDGTDIIDPGIELSPLFEKWLSTYASWVIPHKAWLASVFGSGFPQYMVTDYKWVVYKGYKFGWAHKHSDYMNIANCLGPIILLPVVWFIVQSLKTIGVRPALILFMMIMFTMMAQLTMFDPGKAGVCLMIIALTITDGVRSKKGE
jgi:hypothetical protein